MHWYGGSIAEAVTLSKERNAIFVVFVEGNNDLSTEMAATIDSEAVLTRLSDPANFLAVKLKSGTVNYTHFAQIYQFVPVPSLFFIGRNGTPLEVVCAGVPANNLASRIDRILAEHHIDKPPSVQPSTSSQNVRQQTANLLEAESSGVRVAPQVNTEPTAEPQASVQASNPTQPKRDKPVPGEKSESSSPPAKIQKTEDVKQPEMEIVCEGDVCVRRPKAVDEGASTSGQKTDVRPASSSNKESQHLPPAVENQSSSSIEEKCEEPNPHSVTETPSGGSIEDKMERAKELIEARRREKEEKEKELERQKELERRNAGQGVAELKRWQAEQELKQIQEERKREKLENNMARQRILEQIAQDRAERKARDAPPPPQDAPTPQQHALAPPATSGDSQGSARIQFKLPDGTSHTASFDASGTLRRVRDYVADNLQSSVPLLCVTSPPGSNGRPALVVSDQHHAELDPLSSSNFALWTAFPRRELVETDRTLRELQLAPSAALLVLPRRVATPAPASTSLIAFITQLLTSLIYEPTVQLYTWVRARLFPPPAVAPRGPSPAPPPRAPTAAPLRRRGNIHRLPGDAPDDDNNTWNGNSTQQM